MDSVEKIIDEIRSKRNDETAVSTQDVIRSFKELLSGKYGMDVDEELAEKELSLQGKTYIEFLYCSAGAQIALSLAKKARDGQNELLEQQKLLAEKAEILKEQGIAYIKSAERFANYTI